MMSLWLLAKVTLIVGGALMFSRTVRHVSASVRALVLTCAFGVALGLPITELFIPSFELSLPTNPFTETAPPDGTRSGGPHASLEVLVGEPASFETDITPGVMSPRAFLQSIWLLGVIFALAPIWIALGRASKLMRGSDSWTNAPVSLRRLVNAAYPRRPVDLRLTHQLDVPTVCGIVRPVVLLPTGAQHWPEAHLAHALVHELEHIRRGDPAVLLLARAGCALYWFNPVVWFAWWRLRLEVERACDDAVVVTGHQVGYAEQLVELARRIGRKERTPMIAMSSTTDLTARVTSILDSSQARTKLRAKAVRWAALATCVVAVTAGSLRIATAQGRAEPELQPRPAPITSGARGNVQGVVYDPTGAPLGGLLLIIEQNSFASAGCDQRPRSRGGNCDYNTWTRTDREGRFSVNGLPPGNFHVTSPIDFFPGMAFNIVNGVTLARDLTMKTEPVVGEFTICAECVEFIVPESLIKEFEADRVDSRDHPVSAPHPVSGWEYYKPGKGEYPTVLKDSGVEGSVTIEGAIGVDGVPTAMKAEPSGALGRAAIEALSQEMWEPGRVRGVAIEVPFRFLIRYTLKE